MKSNGSSGGGSCFNQGVSFLVEGVSKGLHFVCMMDVGEERGVLNRKSGLHVCERGFCNRSRRTLSVDRGS